MKLFVQLAQRPASTTIPATGVSQPSARYGSTQSHTDPLDTFVKFGSSEVPRPPGSGSSRASQQTFSRFKTQWDETKKPARTLVEEALSEDHILGGGGEGIVFKHPDMDEFVFKILFASGKESYPCTHLLDADELPMDRLTDLGKEPRYKDAPGNERINALTTRMLRENLDTIAPADGTFEAVSDPFPDINVGQAVGRYGNVLVLKTSPGEPLYPDSWGDVMDANRKARYDGRIETLNRLPYDHIKAFVQQTVMLCQNGHGPDYSQGNIQFDEATGTLTWLDFKMNKPKATPTAEFLKERLTRMLISRDRSPASDMAANALKATLEQAIDDVLSQDTTSNT